MLETTGESLHEPSHVGTHEGAGRRGKLYPSGKRHIWSFPTTVGQGKFPGRSLGEGKGKLEGFIWEAGAKLEFLIATGLFQEACLSVVYQPSAGWLLDHVSLVNQADGTNTISFLPGMQCSSSLVFCCIGLALLKRKIIGILDSCVGQ